MRTDSTRFSWGKTELNENWLAAFVEPRLPCVMLLVIIARADSLCASVSNADQFGLRTKMKTRHAINRAFDACAQTPIQTHKKRNWLPFPDLTIRTSYFFIFSCARSNRSSLVTVIDAAFSVLLCPRLYSFNWNRAGLIRSSHYTFSGVFDDLLLPISKTRQVSCSNIVTMSTRNVWSRISYEKAQSTMNMYCAIVCRFCVGFHYR